MAGRGAGSPSGEGKDFGGASPGRQILPDPSELSAEPPMGRAPGAWPGEVDLLTSYVYN